jgi:hypothetical protein
MLAEKKNYEFYSGLDEINLENEDGYIARDTEGEQKLSPRDVQFAWVGSSKDYYKNSLDKYLDSVDYACEKGNFTTRKISILLNNIPDLASKRLLQISFLFLFLALIIFLMS